MVYPGTWLVLAVLAIIILCLGIVYFYARAHGLLDESVKYAMLENEKRYGDDEYSKPHHSKS